MEDFVEVDEADSQAGVQPYNPWPTDLKHRRWRYQMDFQWDFRTKFGWCLGLECFKSVDRSGIFALHPNLDDNEIDRIAEHVFDAMKVKYKNPTQLWHTTRRRYP